MESPAPYPRPGPGPVGLLLFIAVEVCAAGGCSNSSSTCKTDLDCPGIQKCVQGSCADNPCGVECEAGTFCDGASCAKCDQDHHCGQSCSDCTTNSSNRACVDSLCGCKLAADCSQGQACKFGICTPCTPNCKGRSCGLDPTCGISCGNCTVAGQSCDETTGQCVVQGVSHQGSGQACHCDSPGNCSVKCPTDAGSASVCWVSDNPATGDGLCTFPCTNKLTDAECTTDFPYGCCLDTGTTSTNLLCLPNYFCGKPGGQKYLDVCGTVAAGTCVSGLVCVLFTSDAYCLYPCTYPGGSCQDNGLCEGFLNGGSNGFCQPLGPHGRGEICDPPKDDCVAGLDCLIFSGLKGYCAPFCDCGPTGNCAVGSDCSWTNQEQTLCWCGYLCPSKNVADCPGGGADWNCSDYGTPCQNGTCTSGACNNGRVQCNGNVIETCTNSVWVKGTNCATTGKTCQNGQCISVCTAGQVRCNGSVIQTCTNSAWVDGTDCSYYGCVPK